MRAARRRRETQALSRAIAHFGSMSALGRAVGVSYQAVQTWYKDGVPLERCPQVELATRGKVQCEQLREDFRTLLNRPHQARPAPDAVYLSGPMTGLPDMNYPAFNAEARRLRNAGYRVINPAEVDLPEGTPWAVIMRIDLIDMLSHCSTVAVLPGWARSKGANIEVYLASQLGLRVVAVGDLG